MGTRVSPSYANLFMGVLEKRMIQNCPPHLKQFIYLWKRFIDDILLFWSGTWLQFKEFFEYLNWFHATIKFDEPCYNPQFNSCNFLDLKISIKDRVIRTDLYRKPTDKPRALLPSSAHPNHIPTNIIYSMAFRLLRICDEENIFEERLAELKNNFLLPRSYKSRIIENQFKRVKELPGENYAQRRKLALQKKIRNQDPQTKKRVKAVFDFNPLLPKISTVLKKHHRTMLSDNPELKDSFPDPPMACLRQGPNLRRLLCKSSLIKATRPARATHRSAAGWKRCSHTSGRQCAKCPFTPLTASSVTSHITGYTHHITTPITCTSENVIYLWRCLKCKNSFSVNKKNEIPVNHKCKANEIGSNYAGRTKRQFKTRLGEHLGYIGNDKSEEPSRLHFSLPGHSKHDLQGLGIEQVRSKDPFIIKAREHKYIQLFDSYRRGLNQEP